MKQRWLTRSCVLALSLCAAAPCFAASNRINAYLEPSDQVFMGQQLRLTVHVETDTWFTTAPRYPEIQIPGAIVLQPDAFGVNSSTREEGVTWTGQRRRYLIFPQRTGTLNIPGIEVGFATATDGAPGPATSLVTPALTTTVIAPPGIGNAPFISTPRLTVREGWQPDTAQLQVGDALVRTVTRTATGTFALLFPPIEFSAPDGLRAYPDPPRLEDASGRGVYTATRTDSVTYVLQAPGTFALPPVRLLWLDPDSGQVHEEVLAGRVFEVTESSQAEPMPPASDDQHVVWKRQLLRALGWAQDNVVLLTGAAAALWLTILIWQRLLPVARRRLLAWRRQRSEGESAYFQRVRSAIRNNDADGFVAALWAWSDHLRGRTQPMTLVGLDRLAATDHRWQAFERDRYGAGQRGLPPDVQALIQALRTEAARPPQADLNRGDALNPGRRPVS